MGNYSNLIFYGFCILLVNNIGQSEGTFFGLLNHGSGASRPPAASQRSGAISSPAVGAAPAGGGAAAGAGAANNAILGQLTQISTKLSQLLGGLGNSNGIGTATDTRFSTERMTSTADEEIAPKIGGDDDEAMMMKEEGETDYIVEEHVVMEPEIEDETPEKEAEPTDEEEEIVKPASKTVQSRTGIITNGKKVNNGQIRKSITTSSSGRAASLNTKSKPKIVRVSTPRFGTVAQTRAGVSPAILAAISTTYQPTLQSTGGYYYQGQQPIYQPAPQRVYYQPQPTYQNQPAVQPTYYQRQPTYQSPPTAQQAYYQTQPAPQPAVARTAGYNYQNPNQYRIVRHY